MIFGKIDYLNLLPFHVFLKRSPLKSYVKKSIEFKKGVPSKLNLALRKNRIDAAVISSVESRRKIYKKLDLGIVAKNDVKSVLVRKNSTSSLDNASASSNMLSKVLGLQGEVIIGDRALKAYLNEGEDKFHDMASAWHKKTNLPFVFARFCYRKDGKMYEKLTKNFLRQKVKIPNYILAQYAKTREISQNDIKWYLNFISYKIGAKEKKALFIFLNRAAKLNFKP
ncbi:menaquinone via futalosine step 1 [Campylobacter sp. RM9344]|uniref:Chorismate dehydratase n=1 Tax=Campylobacter californiensis TaxID=1032243 RepID=A0AAW3ZXB7_9BACT|nr:MULTISPECIES: MqnA/MqnD/SBP family protein [unclassified Campylobacter]MBE2984059.1 menaquinone via futalosine step 1 [Campylobacter sp. RM6883]MBE2987115.1 menaquinone via futalosine step 1 [Campylobacter sp. RM12919]MBE2988380.1 menaquinone via futalosine step 1 [Campylobacter sp. RM12920]MBE2995484.1 menaquinone via futalosine step 1 [Campylobacter sp. RM6913]MBE3021970.1 menaquinone via futalosine step 1 [Campylobacter sp. 7477a]MBE3029828.1 menaquinone via futalosine step 1 [Campyloba